MIKWKVGTKLACIKSFKGVDKIGRRLPIPPPKEGEIYTYAGTKGYDDFYSCYYIYLLERGFGGGFNAAHFRPVDEINKEWTEELSKELEKEMEEEYEYMDISIQ